MPSFLEEDSGNVMHVSNADEEEKCTDLAKKKKDMIRREFRFLRQNKW